MMEEHFHEPEQTTKVTTLGELKDLVDRWVLALGPDIHLYYASQLNWDPLPVERGFHLTMVVGIRDPDGDIRIVGAQTKPPFVVAKRWT